MAAPGVALHPSLSGLSFQPHQLHQGRFYNPVKLCWVQIRLFICSFVGMWQRFVGMTSRQHRGKHSHRNKAVNEKASAELHVRPIVFLPSQIWQVYTRHTSAPLIWLDVLFHQSCEPVRLTRRVKADTECLVNTRVCCCLPCLWARVPIPSADQNLQESCRSPVDVEQKRRRLLESKYDSANC